MSKSEAVNKWDLNRIVFIGRIWDEYMRMFGLVKEELVGRKILDCCWGMFLYGSIQSTWNGC